jgi:hypothetical protein
VTLPAGESHRGEKNTLWRSNNAVGDGGFESRQDGTGDDNDNYCRESHIQLHGENDNYRRESHIDDHVPTQKYVPPHLRSQEPLGGCPGKTTHLPSELLGGCPGKTMPWDVKWPKESAAYIRVTPRPETELEDDETVSAYTYIYEDRVVHILESNVYDHDGQDEEDEIARSRIIWERLNPAADWFYCHTDGTRIGDGETIPHHAHIIIGLRDEVDPDWWNRAMQEMKNQDKETFTPPVHWLEDDDEDEEVATETNPEPAQPECLAPPRPDQHGATTQADGGKDAHPDSDANMIIAQGKSASCTADENLRSELETLRDATPNTLRAIIRNHSGPNVLLTRECNCRLPEEGERTMEYSEEPLLFADQWGSLLKNLEDLVRNHSGTGENQRTPRGRKEGRIDDFH